jgi:uncharacterized membrane protein
MHLRRYLVAGLLVWLPVAATILVFRLLLGLLDRIFLLFPTNVRTQLEAVPIPGFGALLAFLILLGTGIFVANLFGRRLVAWYEGVLARIPFVRTVYGGVKSFTEVVLSDKNTAFKKALLIEYPRRGVYSLAFQTSDDPREVQDVTAEDVVTVFLPTTPNPTSGFILFVPRTDIIELEMSVEDALKMIISLGVVVPEPKRLAQRAPVGDPAP